MRLEITLILRFNAQITPLAKYNFSMGVIKSFKAKTVTNLVTPKAAKN